VVGLQISHFRFEIGCGPSHPWGEAASENRTMPNFFGREKVEKFTAQARGVEWSKKKPLHCAGAEEEINRRCHYYVQFICFAGDVKGLGNFFLIMLADSPY